MKWLLASINSISLAVILFLTAVELPVFYKNFYEMEYDKYNILVQLNVSKQDLMDVTDHLLEYMKGNKPNLEVYANVNGEVREFFNEKEKIHMEDVLDLFMKGYLVRRVAIAVFFLTFLILLIIKSKVLDLITLSCQVFFAMILLISGGLIAFIAYNFDLAFEIFHNVFFTNDLWMLDPSTDLLVNIVPIGFFMDISVAIGVLYAVFMLSAMIIASLLRTLIRYPTGKKKPKGSGQGGDPPSREPQPEGR